MHTIEELEKISLAIFNESTGMKQVNEQNAIETDNPTDTTDITDTTDTTGTTDDIETDSTLNNDGDLDVGDVVMYNEKEYTVKSVDPVDGTLTLVSTSDEGDEEWFVNPIDVDIVSRSNSDDSGVVVPNEQPAPPATDSPVKSNPSDEKTGLGNLKNNLNDVHEGKTEKGPVVTESCGKKKKKSKFFKKNFLFTSDKEKKRKIEEATKYGYSLVD